MSQTDALHKLIETMTNQNHGEMIARSDLREACALLGMFPAHRFRQSFHQALGALVKAGFVAVEADDMILLIYTLDEAERGEHKA